MADVSVISVLIKAKDDASKVLENVQTKMGGMAAGFEKHRKSIGLGSCRRKRRNGPKPMLRRRTVTVLT